VLESKFETRVASVKAKICFVAHVPYCPQPADFPARRAAGLAREPDQEEQPEEQARAVLAQPVPDQAKPELHHPLNLLRLRCCRRERLQTRMPRS